MLRPPWVGLALLALGLAAVAHPSSAAAPPAHVPTGPPSVGARDALSTTGPRTPRGEVRQPATSRRLATNGRGTREPAAAAPKVVVSVAPVHGLVAAVMRGVGEPTLLLPAGATPHHGALKPSQHEALGGAALVIWVGPALETFLARAIDALEPRERVITLTQAAGIRLLEARAGGVFPAADERAPDVGAERHADHHHDPHLWLDPRNARAIVALAARALMSLDPPNAPRYLANANKAAARVDALERELGRRLAPIRGIPYVVFHDAYQAFEAHFGLAAVASVAVDPTRAPGAQRLRAVRELIADRGVRCVFAEPQFPPRLAATVVEGTAARVAVLDPLGAEIAPGPDAWFELMRALADALIDCLSAR